MPAEPRALTSTPFYRRIAAEEDGQVVLITRLLAPIPDPTRPPDKPTGPSALGVAEELVRRRSLVDDPLVPPILGVRATAGDGAEWLEPMPRGTTLAELLASAGPLRLDVASSLLHHLARALTALHDQGILMLDLSPDRVLLSPSDEAAILGVGLVGACRTLIPQLRFPDARWEVVFPTPALTAPELVRNDVVDAAADVFSLAGIAYLALTGELPFAGPGALATYRQSQRGEVRDPLQLRPDLGTGVATALRKGLAPHGYQRFERPVELVAAIFGPSSDSARPLFSAIDPYRRWLADTPYDRRFEHTSSAGERARTSPLLAPLADEDRERRLRAAATVLEQMQSAAHRRKRKQQSLAGMLVLIATSAALLLLLLLLFRQ